MTTHIHIFYIDAANGWCEQHRNDQGFQIGESICHYHKVDAIKSAKLVNVPLHIFGKNGLHQRTTVKVR